MKKILTFFLLSIGVQYSLNGQCVFDTAYFDDFEYNVKIDGMIMGTVYHLNPKALKPAHSPTRYAYMNFVNNIAASTLVFDRQYLVCSGNEYQFSAWFNEINGGTSNYTLQVKDAAGSVISTSTQNNSTMAWTSWTSSSFTPTTDTIYFQLVYNSGSGNNDLAMDDLTLEYCQLTPVENDTVVICSGAGVVNLIDSIQGPLGSTGSWTGPSSLTNGALGTFDPSIMQTGLYTYTVANNVGCPDSVGNVYVQTAMVDTAVTLSNFTLQAVATNANYQWINCINNQAIAGATNQQFMPSEDGQYAVVVTQGGCTDTSSCRSVTGLSLLENALPGLSISPNPTQGRVHVNLGGLFEHSTITVVNQLGQIMDVFAQQDQRSFDLQLVHLETGVYYLHIKADERQQIEKIVITH
ncbi:MAG: T9SS type A sorting domain-containing protein [Schleiferiaceae bacterium]|nr:T9SS type A sorting domain-containing protein [Schleiferiaceae bacterium]